MAWGLGTLALRTTLINQQTVRQRSEAALGELTWLIHYLTCETSFAGVIKKEFIFRDGTA